MNHTDYLSLTEQLAEYQKKILWLAKQHSVDFDVQYHTDLSPLGWHLGHCVYMETSWIRDKLLQMETNIDQTHSQYIAELSRKSERNKNLPDYSELHYWCQTTQQQNLNILRQHQPDYEHPLMRHHFLLHFLNQHYGQHIETMHMILMQKALKQNTGFIVEETLTSKPVDPADICVLKAGHYTIGAQTDFLPYDNEYPPHTFMVKNDVNIAKKPVSNGEFLRFIEQSGYENKAYWSEQGWEWKERTGTSHPEFWSRDAHGNWFGIDICGPHILAHDQPVSGLSHFEAQAFCKWSGSRLPHEYEWEASMKNNELENTGQVWEWCENSFHPYITKQQKFRPFPYSSYSIPYFDGRHFVMRGGSRYTQKPLKRNSFRNYYRAEKRYQIAGFRILF